MSKVNEIQHFLNKPFDFQEGLRLYEKYGKNANLRFRFARKGNTEYNRNKMVLELQRLKDRAEIVEVPETKEPRQKSQEQPKAQKNQEPQTTNNKQGTTNNKQQTKNDQPQSLSEEDKKAKEEELEAYWKSTYKQASHLHQTQLTKDATQEERKDAAFRILNAFENDIQPTWKQLDYLREHGQLPQEPKPTKIDTSNLANVQKRIQTVNTYISKYQDDPAHEEKYRQYLKEKQYLESILNNE